MIEAYISLLKHLFWRFLGPVGVVIAFVLLIIFAKNELYFGTAGTLIFGVVSALMGSLALAGNVAAILMINLWVTARRQGMSLEQFAALSEDDQKRVITHRRQR